MSLVSAVVFSNSSDACNTQRSSRQLHYFQVIQQVCFSKVYIIYAMVCPPQVEVSLEERSIFKFIFYF